MRDDARGEKRVRQKKSHVANGGMLLVGENPRFLSPSGIRAAIYGRRMRVRASSRMSVHRHKRPRRRRPPRPASPRVQGEPRDRFADPCIDAARPPARAQRQTALASTGTVSAVASGNLKRGPALAALERRSGTEVRSPLRATARVQCLQSSNGPRSGRNNPRAEDSRTLLQQGDEQDGRGGKRRLHAPCRPRAYSGQTATKKSGREDLNLRPQRPERCALPSCATPRQTSS